MLKRLRINNVALISELELEFGDHLNILSGETGAGKSIIVDCLMLLLGGKYDKTLLRFGEKQGFVEGIFELPKHKQALLSEYGLDEEDMIVVSRRFTSDGKNDIRVNGKSFTASMLKGLTSSLVDIYGQNEYQSLSKPSEHLRILDYYIRNDSGELLGKIENKYNEYKNIKSELNRLGNISERERNIDIYKYQIEEIERAKIKQGEEEEIVAKRKLISSAEKIATSISEAISSLSDDNRRESAADLISAALHSLGSISDSKPIFSELYERLNSVSIEIDDITETLTTELDGLDFDEREIDRVERRYDLILSLKRKYGPYDKMIAYLQEIKEALYELENCSQLYEDLEKSREETVKQLYDYSMQLSAMRRKKAKELEQAIIDELRELGMENSRFEIVFNGTPKLDECENCLSIKGFDKPEFYLSPNAGQPLKPLIKIISGGEMSRFMLALKVISSQTDDIGTLIFDEVDTGISGKIGQEVAKKLAKIASAHQVLCVTHLAQIAAMADSHFYIEKVISGEQTNTQVSLLDADGMIEEISRLSGGKDISSQAHQNAMEMKNWSNLYKEKL